MKIVIYSNQRRHNIKETYCYDYSYKKHYLQVRQLNFVWHVQLRALPGAVLPLYKKKGMPVPLSTYKQIFGSRWLAAGRIQPSVSSQGLFSIDVGRKMSVLK